MGVYFSAIINFIDSQLKGVFMKKKIFGFAMAVMLVSGAAMAQEVQKTEKAEPSLIEQTKNQAIYAKVGFPGVGLGYAYGVNKNWGVRADFSTIGNYSTNETSGDLDYAAKLKYNQVGVYGDYFPFQGAFRISAGMQYRDAKVRGDGRPNASNQLSVGNTTVVVNQNDQLTAQIKMPTLAPYIGIGWGLNTAANKSGWSLFADVGVTIGKPKVSLQVNDSLMGKLDTAAATNGTTGQAELDKQVADLKKDSDKLRVVPQVFIGVAYKF